MGIKFSCTNCGKQLEADDFGAGLTIPCPKCGRNLTIPAPPAAKEVSETTQNSVELKVGQQIKGQDVFHISLDDKINGPLTLHELAALYHDGAFQSDTVFSKNNSEHWRPISEIIPMLK
ncbi:MAG: GYF domain-containing protein [Verrucomicrobiia bacterium]|jgi:DNA-directed RNA polymerase subunit RPC12/RpoP